MIAGALALANCATLPSSGPTGYQIEKGVAMRASPALPLQLVEIDDPQALPKAPALPPLKIFNLPALPTDLIGPGDVLDIAIYESGVTLFGGETKVSSDAVSFDSTAKVEHLLGNRVNDAGDILVPYAGHLHVAGSTVGQVEQRIRAALRGYSQNPQVLISIRENLTNSVIVGGEVAKPGRLVLQTNQVSVSDAVALAGGYKGDAKDLVVRIARKNEVGEFRLSEALNGDAEKLLIYPGDRVSVLRAARSFSVMGAPGQVQLFPFNASKVSLAEAIAQAGGSNAMFGDPAAIFVFRYVIGTDGITHPVVYHIDMMKPGSYLLSQHFAMLDKDVMYIGNARANQPTKLIQIISQLFSPIVTVVSAAQVLK